VIAPPSRPQALAKSAKLLFSWSWYSSAIGNVPGAVLRAPAGFLDCGGQLVVVAHHPRWCARERYHAGAGERRDVHHRGGLKRASR